MNGIHQGRAEKRGKSVNPRVNEIIQVKPLAWGLAWSTQTSAARRPWLEGRKRQVGDDQRVVMPHLPPALHH